MDELMLAAARAALTRQKIAAAKEAGWRLPAALGGAGILGLLGLRSAMPNIQAKADEIQKLRNPQVHEAPPVTPLVQPPQVKQNPRRRISQMVSSVLGKPAGSVVRNFQNAYAPK